MKIAFMFAGQGAQYSKMGYDLYEADPSTKELFDNYKEIKDIIFKEDSTALNETKYAQPAILLESYAIAKYLSDKGIKPEYACGLSLGEYSALTYANTFTIDDAVKITSRRGEIMQNALPLGTSSMAAIMGLDAFSIIDTIKDVEGVCEIANYNSPSQIVITGDNKAIDEAMIKLKERGAKRCIKLNVSGAFHSSLLYNASLELHEELKKYEIKKPDIKIIYNTYGTTSSEPIIDILTKQIKSSVQFVKSIEYMIDKGVDTFIEIGPGNTLQGFVKKINPNVKVYSTNKLDDINKVLEELL